MLDPIEMEEMNLADWNRAVSGIMKLWDAAEVLGLTACLTQHLEELPQSALAIRLAEKGNCRETYVQLFLLSLRVLLTDDRLDSGAGPEHAPGEALLSVLDTVLLHDAQRTLRPWLDSREADQAVVSLCR